VVCKSEAGDTRICETCLDQLKLVHGLGRSERYDRAGRLKSSPNYYDRSDLRSEIGISAPYVSGTITMLPWTTFLSEDRRRGMSFALDQVGVGCQQSEDFIYESWTAFALFFNHHGRVYQPDEEG
jgi:hypothetical protein